MRNAATKLQGAPRAKIQRDTRKLSAPPVLAAILGMLAPARKCMLNTRGRMFPLLLVAIALCAMPAQAAPFAYVANFGSNTVSVIDRATNTVVATVPVGTMPMGVAMTPDGAFAYVTNTGSNTVSVIATATNTVVATVPVGVGALGVAITPNGASAYVTNQGSNTVSVIATATNTVVATVQVGPNPVGVAITPNGAFAYVANYASNTVSVIATTTNSVVATVTVGPNPYLIAITPDGASAYVTNSGSDTVSVIATATNTVSATVAVGAYPRGVAITPNGTSAYVVNCGSRTVSVIATATNTVVATVPVATAQFTDLAITPDGAFAYVPDFGSNYVSMIATATNAVAVIVTVGSNPFGVAFTQGTLPPPTGPFAYVTNQASNSVSVIDRATNTVVTAVPVGTSPTGVAVTPNGAFAYVVNQGSNTVSVIATATNTVVATVPVGAEPLWVAITPNGAFAYVTNHQSWTVSVIATATDAVVATVPVGAYPVGVAITPDGAFAYVTNNYSNTVSVIATASNAVVANVVVGQAPWLVAITPDGTFAYVANRGSNTVSVIATASNTVVATIPGFVTPQGVAITPDGAFAYVTNYDGTTVSVIATATNTLVATVTVGANAVGVTVSPDGAFAYATNAHSHTVSVIATATNTVADTIPVGAGPELVAFAPQESGPAVLLTPTPGSTLTSTSASFSWNPVTGADQYWLDVGNSVGVGDLWAGALTGTSQVVSGLPCDGRTIYVQMYTHLSGAWLSPQRYTYTAPSACLAQIASPAPGTLLTATTITFTWSAASGADQYWLDVGNSVGSGGLWAGALTGTSQVVGGIPCDGRTIYVQLYTHRGGTWLTPQRYTYTAASVCMAQITSPTPGTLLTATTITFAWSTASGADQYWLDVGNSIGQGDLWGGALTGTSQVVTGLPCNGRTLYVQLYTYRGGTWLTPQRYTYTAPSVCLAQIAAPTPGTTLSATSVTFSWSTGAGADQYWLDVGNSVGQGDLWGGALTATSRLVSGLPCDGRTLYVQLYTHRSGAWLAPQRYTYTAPSVCLAQIISPTPGTTLLATTVTFSWSTDPGADQYWLDAGNSVGSGGIWGGALTGTSQVVSGLPCDGSTIYVQLYTHRNGVWLTPQRYNFTAKTTCAP